MPDKSAKQSGPPTSKRIEQPSSGQFRPSEFMRARRPGLFSDSKLIGEPRLTQEIFEYHLETLTSRKQETAFEHFARRLAEKELCPNLLPQTGPTGGGDSKVDTETYPVADGISLRWYEGIGREASQERWAFAFSAKAKWRSKVQSDVKNIAETNRGYKLIYFITNQFVRDKVRAEVEEKLKKEHNIEVRILDRTWIVKSVFEHDRLQLAIETLNLTGYDELSRKVVGPQDARREAELKVLEEQINDSARYQGVEYQLAEDCLQAALLARALELPRVEIEGRFARAKRVAERVDHPQQRLRVFYNMAWTAFWWYDDFAELNRLYDQVEELAVGSAQATDLGLLANLWTVLNSTVARGQLDAVTAKLDARTATLNAELDRLATDEKRPSRALWARSSKLLMELHAALGEPERASRILTDLKDIIAATEGLTAYPLEPIAEIIQELGDVFTDSAQYDELFETVVEVTGSRLNEGEAGRALLRRGFQKLRQGKTYDAIRLFGRGQLKLAMREYRGEFVTALLGCGSGYEAAGLLWAARANVLSAANQALAEYWEHGLLVPQTLTCLQRLVWLELQLGRIPCALMWRDAADVIARQLLLDDDDRRQAYVEERVAQDRVLAILLLRTELWELKWLDFLPEILDQQGLDYSWMALLYALGYEDYLRSEGVLPESEDQNAVRDLFQTWVKQPAGEDIPEEPQLLRESTITLRSIVLGCEFRAEVANSPLSIYLTETILGAIEALLATSLDASIYPHVAEFTIKVEPSDFIADLPEYEIDDDRQAAHIKHSASLHEQVSDNQGAFRDWLQELVIQVTFRTLMINDIESYAHHLFGEEMGLGRAFNFSEPSIPIKNILGDKPKFRLSDWEAIAKGQRFPLRRNTPWDNELKQINAEEKVEPRELRPGEGEPPPELLDIDKLKHRDRRVFSLVNISLWNKAEWTGTMFMTAPDLPPCLGIGFKNIEAGQTIFRGWLSKLGRIDEEEQLRVSVITGINKSHPASYKVVIGTNPEFADRYSSAGKHFVMVSRVNQMDPPDTKNLDRFIAHYNKVGKYILLPAQFINQYVEPKPLLQLGIGKEQLYIRPAWQLGENDPDVVAIQEDDDPIIPEGVENAPVLRALQRFSRGKGKAGKQEFSPEAAKIIKEYSEKLSLSDPKAIISFFGYLSKDVPKGHWPCYCGSGKKLRQCHTGQLHEFRARITVNEAREVLKQLMGHEPHMPSL